MLMLRSIAGRSFGAFFSRGVLPAILVGAATLGLWAQNPTAGSPDNPVDYEISARLEDGTHILHGQEKITWTNGSQDQVSDLWFHTYLNAFANTESTHLSESGGSLRGHMIKGGWGWTRIQRVTLVGPEGQLEVTPTLLWQAPDDDNPEDRTVFSVKLPRPVAPGESIRVDVEWESQLQRVRRRTGYKDDFMLVAQWFPKLGVYETGKGWNCHQFHSTTEFYSDYGTYSVSLDLPARYEGKVQGSGVRVLERLTGDDRVLVKFEAPSKEDRASLDRTGKAPRVHDFTWTADSKFIVRQYTFVFEEWRKEFADEVNYVQAALGDKKDIALRNVRVTVMIQPEREDQAYRHFKATAAALFFYGLWFGEYPYEHITVVDPAWGGGAAGGMEYPTIFTAGTEMGTNPDMYTPESVTVHEAGHQFWYGLVGNNEFESAWMDEGFNSYADSQVLWLTFGYDRETTKYSGIHHYGTALTPTSGGGTVLAAISGRRIPYWKGKSITPLTSQSGVLNWWRDQPLFTLSPQNSDPRWGDRSAYLRDPNIDPVDTNAWEYRDNGSYRTNSYYRPAVVLRSLEGLVERDHFLRGMRHYAETWRYKHPTPDDFFAAFNAGAEVDVSWYFDELFRGTGTVDWSVSVSHKDVKKPAGLFQDESGMWVADPDREKPGVGSTNGEVMLMREGELCLPVLVRVTFADDSEQDFVWTREEQQANRWKRLEFPGTKRIVSAVMDPERDWYIDTDMSNNQWYNKSDEVAPLRWGERAFSGLSFALQFTMGIGG